MSIGNAIQASIGGDVTDLNKAGEKVEAIAKKMEGALQSIGVAFEIGAVIEFTKSITEQFSRVADLAKQTGLTTDAIQTFSYFSKLAGQDDQLLINATQKLRVSMGDLADGSETVSKALKVLNLDQEELLALPLDQQLEAVAKAYVEADDKQAAFSATVKLLGGKNVPRLMEVIAELGEKGLAKMTAQAKAAGQVLDADLVGALNRAEQHVQTFWNALKVGAGTILGALISAPEHLGKLLGGLVYGSEAVFGTWQKTTAEIDNSAAALKRMNDLTDAYRAAAAQYWSEQAKLAGFVAAVKKKDNEDARKELALAEADDAAYAAEQKRNLDELNAKKAELVRAAAAQAAAEQAIADQIKRQVDYEQTLGTMKEASFDKGAMYTLGGERTYNSAGDQLAYEKSLREEALREIDSQIAETQARIQKLQSYAGTGARTGTYELPALQSQLSALRGREQHIDSFLFDPRYQDALGRSIPGQQAATLSGQSENLLKRAADGIDQLNTTLTSGRVQVGTIPINRPGTG